MSWRGAVSYARGTPVARPDHRTQPLNRNARQDVFFFFITLSDTRMYEPYIRALLRMAIALREVDGDVMAVGARRPPVHGRHGQVSPLGPYSRNSPRAYGDPSEGGCFAFKRHNN